MKAVAIWFITLLAGSALQSIYLFATGDKQLLGLVPLMFVFGLPVSSPAILVLWFILDTIIRITGNKYEKCILLFVGIAIINGCLHYFAFKSAESVNFLQNNTLHLLGGYTAASFIVACILCRRILLLHHKHHATGSLW